MDSLDCMADIVIGRISLYNYETFTVGVTTKTRVLDRDDYIRSEMSASGVMSIKTALSNGIAKIISRKTSGVLDREDPDITILVDTRFGSCDVRSRRVVLYMRYTKTRRGLPQKSTPDEPEPSIEGMLADYVLYVMGGTGVRFTWVGGEDRNSQVLGAGRPIYVQVYNPVMPASNLPGSISFDGVHVTGICKMDGVPDNLPSFISAVRILVRCGSAPNLRPLKTLAGMIRLERDSKPSHKTVGQVRYRRVAHDLVRMYVEVEGGTPIKRLVTGEGVHPSVSSVLGVECACVRFDFLDIHTKD